MMASGTSFSVLLSLLLVLLGMRGVVAQQACLDQRTCRDCIRTANCQWCEDVDFEGDRCRLAFAESACTIISDPTGDPPQATRPTNLDEVAVSPERVVLNQRVGSKDAQTFQVNVTALRNIPLDLYILMDLSGSMARVLDNVKNVSSEIIGSLSSITSNVRFGFGSFNDKPTRPFTSQKTINDHCNIDPPSPFCPYAFRHQISLTEDENAFGARINAADTTVNVDGPENGLEGLAQVVTCEDIIGWRDRSATGPDRGLNRFILFITDDAFHYSGEGRLAGTLKPYNGRCLLDSSAIVNGSVDYTQWDVYDYPSVGQVAALLDEFNVVPIFAAVVENRIDIDVLGTYQNLADVISLSHRANAAQLQGGSADILDVIREEVEATLQTVALSPSPDDSFDISFDISATCPPGATLVEGMACDGVQQDQMVSFEVTVTLNSCYDQNTGELLEFPISIRVDVLGFGELNLTINGNCDCDIGENRLTTRQISSGNKGACNDATMSQVCNLNNMDTQEPIVRVSPASDVDLFGFAVVLHQLAPLAPNDDLHTALGKTRIIIGAPKGTYPGGLPLDDPGENHVNETGLIYMCPVEPGECEGVRGDLSLYASDLVNDMDNPEGRLFDHYPDTRVPSGGGFLQEYEIKTGQLLGMTLFSNGDTFMACAPRWTFHPNFPQPRGRCYWSDRTLQGFTRLYPCSVIADGSTTMTDGNGYCLTGTGVTAVDNSGNKTFVLGSPGFDNGRGVLYFHEEGDFDVDGREVFVQGQSLQLDSNDVLTDLLAVYQGYQVINGYITNSRTSGQTPDIIASVPRYNVSTHTGTVNIYDVNDPATPLSVSASGQQMGEFFGYSLVAADLTGDGYDELIVGAPMYSDIIGGRVEKGRVFVFENLGGTLSDEPVILLGEVVNGRFGSSLANIGDVDNDGYEDLVVGAPYACSSPPNCDNQNTGTVFIYYGRADLQTFGDQTPYMIHSGDIVDAVTGLDELFTFGFSLSSGVDIDNNQYNDLVVGAYDSKVAIVIRSLPVADVNINLPVVDPLDFEQTNCVYNGDRFSCFDLKIEANYSGRGLSGPLEVNFILNEVISGEQGILFFEGNTSESFSGTLRFEDINIQTVEMVRVYARKPEEIEDISNPIMVEISAEEIQRPLAPIDYDGNQTLNDLSPYPRLRVNGTLELVIETICGAEVVDDYFWPDTPAGQSAMLVCMEGSTVVVTRVCEYPGKWLVADLSQCALELFEKLLQAKSNGTNVTAETYEEDIRVLSLFAVNAPDENRTAQNLEVIVDTISAASTIAADPQTTVAEETVIDTIQVLDGLSDWNEEVLEGSDEVPLVVQAFEVITTAFVTQDNFTNFTFSGQKIAVTVDRVEVETLQRVGERVSGFSNEGQLDAMIEEVEDGNLPEFAPQQVASAFLPPALFQRLGNDTEIEVIFALYEDGVLFPVEEEPQSPGASVVVGTPVLSASVGNLELEGLSGEESVTILLQQNDLGNVTVTRVRCVSFDFDSLQWTTDGCKTEVDNDVITCTCNHLTNFAALVDICSRTDDDCLNDKEQFTLDIISIVGVVLSLLGITLTIINFLAFKKLRQRDVSKYHVQLCIALACMLLVFVIGIDRTEVYEGCVTVSALIHYFTLVSVMWMAAEAVLIFQKIVVVFVQITTKYIIGVSLFCWLAPIVPVVIPLAIDESFMVSYTDSSETDIQFCFIGEVGVFFGAFLGPIFAILLFNCVIFFIVVSVLIKHKMGTLKRKQEQMDLKTAIRLIASISGVVVLFGLSWLFGAFTVAEASFAFQFLFVVFNSLQGFFIFFFFCALNKESRELWIGVLNCTKSKPSFLPMKTTSGTNTLQKTATTAAASSLTCKPAAVLFSDDEGSIEMPEIIKDPCAYKENTATEEGLYI